MDDWEGDLVSLAGDEEPEVLDMETVSENPDSNLDPQQEAIDIAELERSRFPLQVGDSQYLISMRWFEDWAAYAGGYPPGEQTVIRAEETKQRSPGTMDNSELLESDAVDKLKPDLREGRDFKLVFEEAWTYLHRAYGGGPAITRRVVMQKDKPIVEIYPIVMHFRKSSEPNKLVNVTISIEATLAELKTKACRAFNLEEVDVIMYDYWNNTLYLAPDGPVEEHLDETMGGGRLADQNPMILVEKNEEGVFPPLPSNKPAVDDASQLGTPNQPGRSTVIVTPATNSTYGRNSYATDTIHQVEAKEKGLAGLSNLGNTCFMNSSVQCLAHAAPLVRVFLSGAYKRDLNPDNPLGNKGELAEAFGNLLKLLWQGNVSSVSPKGFKAALARFAPQFQGYAQQDSQELLAFLLDGLHEDLNRVRNKPYVEEADANGRPDKVVAAEAWANYRKRNNSVVVDHFQGLYKSTLVCPQCSFSSVKFDPFMYLSLPLPTPKTRTLYITLIHVDGSLLPITHAVTVSKTATIADVYKGLAQHAGVDSAAGDPMGLLLLAALGGHHISTTFTDPAQRVADIRKAATLLAYRYAAPAQGPKSGHSEVHFFHRRRNRKRGMTSYHVSEAFAAPLVLFLSAENIQALKDQTVKESVEYNATEYTVRQPNEVEVMLEDALRPFKRAKIEDESAPASGSEQADSTRLQEGSTAGDHNQATPSIYANHTNASVSSAQAEVFGTASTAPAFGRAAEDPPDEHWRTGVTMADDEAMQDPDDGDPDAEFNRALSDEESQPIEEEPLKGAAGDGEASSADPNEMQQPPLSRQWPGLFTPSSAGPVSTDRGGWGEHDRSSPEPLEHGPKWTTDMDDGREQSPRPGSLGCAMGSPGTEPSAAPNVTPQVTPSPNVSPAGSPMGSPRGPTFPPVQPFNMWDLQTAAQEESEEPAAAVHPMASSNGNLKLHRPWQLKWADSQGRTALYCEPAATDRELHFAVEWAAEGSTEYDVAALESPRLSDSAQAAKQSEHDSAQARFTLHQCLEAFLQPEQLDTTETWYCGRCKEHVQAEKKLDLWSLPELLVVHLKRFSYSRTSRDKLDAPVDFPLSNLDLSSFVLRQQETAPVYDLFAVSNHYGGLGGGHYTAYCRAGNDGSWHCFDDCHVTPVDEAAVQSQSAYVLFFRRRHEALRDPAGMPDDLEDKEMADNAAAASAPPHVQQLANGSAQAGSAASENGQAAEGTADDAAKAGSAAEEAHANGGSPRTQLGGSFVFVSDGGSSKEDDLYGDSNQDGGSAALQLSPADASGLNNARPSSAVQEGDELIKPSVTGFTTSRRLFEPEAL